MRATAATAATQATAVDTMAHDEAKRWILARRARFVAAAVASIAGAGTAVTACEPEVCLSVVSNDDGGGDDAEPQPCLAPFPRDASDDTSDDSATDTGSDAPSDAEADAAEGG